MGSGKTTLGRKLAEIVKTGFIDLDDLIEKSENKSIAELFSLKGEKWFRRRESEILEDILKIQEPKIISLGGGTVCFNNNLEKIKKSGLLIYIQLPAKELSTRLEENSGQRPLLKGLKGEALQGLILKLLNQRQKYYQLAELTINGLNLEAEKLAKKIIEHEEKNN